MNIADMTVNVRILVGGEVMPAMWRIRLLVFVARLLSVPLEATVRRDP